MYLFLWLHILKIKTHVWLISPYHFMTLLLKTWPPTISSNCGTHESFVVAGQIYDSQSFFKRFPNFYQNKPPAPSTNIFTTPLLLLFNRFYEKLLTSHGTVWKHEQKGGTCCGNYILTTWEGLSGFGLIKKCMFDLAHLKQWRDSSQWGCCAKLGCNLICTRQPVFVVLLTQTLRQALPLLNWAAFISHLRT